MRQQTLVSAQAVRTRDESLSAGQPDLGSACFGVYGHCNLCILPIGLPVRTDGLPTPATAAAGSAAECTVSLKLSNLFLEASCEDHHGKQLKFTSPQLLLVALSSKNDPSAAMQYRYLA